MTAEAKPATTISQLERVALEWRLTFDSVPEIILVLNEQGNIRRLNRAARDAAGLSSYTAALGHPLSDLGAGEPWDALHAAARDAGKPGTISRQVRDDKTGRAWYVAASPIHAAGGLHGMIVLAQDTTEIVALQDSLKKTERITALGRLVAGVVHEVRNPLFAITAMLDTWDAERGPGTPSDPLRNGLRTEVSRLNALMTDLLEYGRPVDLTWSSESVEEVVREAVPICAPLAKQHGVEIHIEAVRPLPALLMDRARMVQVFQNGIDNAIRHSPRSGRVLVRIELDEDAEALTITIRDSGPGFSPEALQRAFEPFYTLRRGGTGMGLSIVERIAEQHGASVDVRNAVDGGGVLTIRFPCTPSLGEPSEP